MKSPVVPVVGEESLGSAVSQSGMALHGANSGSEPSAAKIYVFSNVRGGGDGPCYAMAEDGAVLGSHYCSHESFAPGDLGVIPGSRPDRHETYAAHYPGGYELVFVRAADVPTHPGLSAAFALNQKAAEAAAADTSRANDPLRDEQP